MENALITSLRAAVAAAPRDLPLRLHLAGLLLASGQTEEAIDHAAAALAIDSDSVEARALMESALRPAPVPEHADEAIGMFDWNALEGEVGDMAKPMFVRVSGGEFDSVIDVERPEITLTDVGGMRAVKDRLNAAFLAPLRNPELRRLYAKSLRGGLLMYGPPGCGKTFIARAVAGELKAKFISVSLTDILDPMLGTSEANVREVFQRARREAPCVLFLDEVDALAQRRSQTRNSGTRGVVNQLLSELDGVENANDGVFVLAATNQPWDIDPAMRGPGRLDRTVLVLPPDREAREAIFRFHFAQRPVEGIDLTALARRTDGLSGADIAYVCEVASERALLDSASSGEIRMITMDDALRALAEVRPSATAWFDSARTAVMFSNDDGTYDELRAHLKATNRL